MAKGTGVTRTWEIGAGPDGVLDRAAVQDALMEVEAVGDKLGGAFMLYPLRQRTGGEILGEPEFETHGWQLLWQSLAPSRPAPAEAGEPDEADEPDEEPVAEDLEPVAAEA